MKFFDIVFKDLRVILRDKVALMFIFLMPVVLIVILSFALGSVLSTQEVSIGLINIGIVDNDNLNNAAPHTSDASIYSVLNSEELASLISYCVLDEQNAKDKLSVGEIDAYITIPNGFLPAVESSMGGVNSGRLEIKVTGSANSVLKAGIVSNIAKHYTQTLSNTSTAVKLLNDFLQNNDSAQYAGHVDIASYIKSVAQPSALDLRFEGVSARKPLSSFSYYSIAITCMFVLYAAGQGSTFLYTESEEHTLARLSAAGVSGIKLLCSKAFTVFLLCLIQLTVLLGFSTLAFGIDWGNPYVFLAVSACVACSVTGLGALLMVIVYRTGNPSIGSVFQSIIVQVLALFGGSFIPLAMLPEFFSSLALFTPNGLAVMAYTGNVSGAPLEEILPFMAGSVVFGIIFTVAGAALFPRERRA